MLVRFSKLAVVVGWLLSGLLTTNASADAYPEIMLILDSSGSMSEVVAGKQKIVAAKEVMHDVVPQLDENIRVGLTAYGHRRAGDCTDIETLIPAGSNDRQELLSQIDHLQPKGRTPISSAILSVANQLKMKDAETTIILVSDGIETCGGDPCQVVAQLNATGVKFVLHVVGFDVDASAAQQLQCLAEQGRGRYFPAADATELLKALQEVSAEVLEKVQQVDPAKVNAKAARSGLGKLRVTMPIGSEVSLKNLKIGNPDSGDVKRTVEGPKPDGTYPLLSGTYFVSLGFATPSYGRPTESSLGEVTISKGETRRLSLGSISFNIAKALEEKIAVEEVLITDAGTDHVVARVRKNGNTYYHFKPKPMVAGVYDVQFLYSINKRAAPTVVARTVVVQPGKDTVVTLDSGFQLQPGTDVLGWELIPVQTASADGHGEGTATAAPAINVRHGGVVGNNDRLWSPYVVPPGTYDLNVFIKGMDEPLPVGEDIAIKSGDLVNFDAGL